MSKPKGAKKLKPVERLWTYDEIAEHFRVRISTVRKWKCAGQFEIWGYKRLGKWCKIALVEDSEVALLQIKKYPQIKRIRRER